MNWYLAAYMAIGFFLWIIFSLMFVPPIFYFSWRGIFAGLLGAILWPVTLLILLLVRP